MSKILLVGNPSHPGIVAVADAYNRAFQYLGFSFDYFRFQDEPKLSVGEANAMVQWKIFSSSYKIVVFIQPSYLHWNTIRQLMNARRIGTQFYSINTEDPYSTSVILQSSILYDKIFTNELRCADLSDKFHYLPLAFDCIQPFFSPEKKTIDLCGILTYYQNRYDYVMALEKLDCEKWFAGTVGPLMKNRNSPEPIDVSFMSLMPYMVPRHKELETYRRSRFVLNPHRQESMLGKSYLFLMEGDDARPVVKHAVSPNPRYFDAIACGAIPLCDPSRTECFEILKKYKVENVNAYTLPKKEAAVPALQERVNNWHLFELETLTLAEEFLDHETYVERAKEVASIAKF